MNRTNIEYLDFTWNPVAMLCDPVSAGCKKCWHRTRAAMLAKNPSIPKEHQAAYAGRSGPILIKSRLGQPIKRKRPAIIGVQFMGDLWHENNDWPTIDQIFYACHKAYQHTYVFLTKRIEAAWYYFDSPIYEDQSRPRRMLLSDNIYFGTSIEDQKTADERINLLMQIAADTRILSVEPMLEKINLIKRLNIKSRCSSCGETSIDTQNHGCLFGSGGVCCCGGYLTYQDYQPLNWIIAGPETGPGARACPEGAIEDLYEQAKAAGVPFFDKRENFIVREYPKEQPCQS